MAVNSAMPPFFTFTDGNGLPLENGYIYIGQPGFEARTTPKASFFNLALTIPTGTASGAAIRTRGGFPVNQSNAPATFYVDGDYSISVCDRNGVLLYSALSMTFALNVGAAVGPILASDGNLAAPGISFLDETSTGFSRNNAASIQVSAGGVLVATLTSTGTTFAQPTSFTGLVSGAGFSSGVLAIAQPLDSDLTAIAGLSSTGIAVRTAANTWAQRQITSPDGSIGITNPAGVAGDIQLSTATIPTLVTTTGAGPVGNWSLPALKKFEISSKKSALSGTDNMLVQLRSGGVWVTSGYDSGSVSGARNVSSTSGFIVSLGGSSSFWAGIMRLMLHDPATNTWAANLASGPSNATNTDPITTWGFVTLSGAIDGVRIAASGSNTFVNTSFNILY